MMLRYRYRFARVLTTLARRIDTRLWTTSYTPAFIELDSMSVDKLRPRLEAARARAREAASQS